VLTDDGRVLDLSSLIPEIDGAFLAGDGIGRVRAALDASLLPEISIDGERIGTPIARPGKVVCIGLNYRGHARKPASRCRRGRRSS